jgi:membrane associated rhomboid family serine protease
MNITPVVKQLLILNVLFFIGSQFVPLADSYFALYYFENPMFKIWQPLTHMFMHGGVAHIAFNMFALYSFGSALEHFWGGKKFLFFYISCGLGAALLHSAVNYFQIHSLMSSVSNLNLTSSEMSTLLNSRLNDVFDASGQMAQGKIKSILERVHCTQEQFNIIAEANAQSRTPAVGASGAIYGLLTAFAFMFPNAELALMFIPVPIKAKYFVPGLVLMDLFSGVTGISIFGGGNIAHFAHIGGALCGFIMMWFWKKNQFDKNRWD